jgi:hypothetical protein
MPSLSTYLNEWNKCCYLDQNDEFNTEIEILVQKFVKKKDKLKFIETIKTMGRLEQSTGIMMQDFKQSEMNFIIDIIKKYSGMFISYKGEESGSEFHKYEDNIIVACFPTPLLAFDCLTEYLTNE